MTSPPSSEAAPAAPLQEKAIRWMGRYFIAIAAAAVFLGAVLVPAGVEL